MTLPLLTRRAVVGSAIAVPALLHAGGRAIPIGPDSPFTLGVASGDDDAEWLDKLLRLTTDELPTPKSPRKLKRGT